MGKKLQSLNIPYSPELWKAMEPPLWFLSPIARVISAPDSHPLLYTPPLTAAVKLLVTYIIGETMIAFYIVNI